MLMELPRRKGNVVCSPAMRAALRGSATASKISLAVAAALAVSPPPVLALETSDVTALQEIVVTARKRQENLQDVPLSIDVFTKKDMQNLGIASFDDYAQKVPSISFISVGPGPRCSQCGWARPSTQRQWFFTSAAGRGPAAPGQRPRLICGPGERHARKLHRL